MTTFRPVRDLCNDQRFQYLVRLVYSYVPKLQRNGPIWTACISDLRAGRMQSSTRAKLTLYGVGSGENRMSR